MLFDQVSSDSKKIIQKCITAANQLGLNVYLVGGSVRDLFLNKTAFDLDFAIEGNGIEFAQFLGPSLSGKVKKYEDFKSATLLLPNDQQIDIVTARKEYYPEYGVLPLIEPANIIHDLKRRDFSINSLAIHLNSSYGQRIIDPYGGMDDLKHGLIKILHKDSFNEDPIRILRAAKFLHRLNFNLEKDTEISLLNSVSYLQKVSPSRVKLEFLKVVKERNVLKILEQLKVWEATEFFLPGINLQRISQRLIDFIKTWCADREDIDIWLIILMLIYWQSMPNLNKIREVKFIASNKEKKCINWLLANQYNIKHLIDSANQVSFLKLHKIMYNVPEEAEIFVACLLGENKFQILSDLKLARKGVELPINGRDLLKKGLQPGPQIGRILSALEQEVLKGNIYSREEAFIWLEKVRGNNVN